MRTWTPVVYVGTDLPPIPVPLAFVWGLIAGAAVTALGFLAVLYLPVVA